MTTTGPIETAVCVTVSAKQAEEYAVVLAASGIPSRLEATDAGWVLMVAARDAVPAVDALAAYDEENRDGAPIEALLPAYGETWIGALIAALLVGFFAVTGPPERASIWFDQGSASAQQILAGELWRTVTALTLHANVAHVSATRSPAWSSSPPSHGGSGRESAPGWSCSPGRAETR